MKLDRLTQAAKTWIIVRLDQFLSWPPVAIISTIVVLTVALIWFWAALWSWSTGQSMGAGLWFSVTRFMDGGTMAVDEGGTIRILAIGVTTTGILVISFLTGAFASKLGERIDDLRSGRSPIAERGHILILGFDAKVPLILRELARSHQRLRVVILAQEEKPRLDLQLRFLHRIPGARLKVISRTGDPRSELSLLRVCSERARAILVISPPKLDDDHALRWTVSALLALRRAVGSCFTGRVVVEARRASQERLLRLTCEPGVAAKRELPLDIVASDDIVARVLAQSVRQNGVYFALRELLSFRGSELYLERVPDSLIGKSFEDAHAVIEQGIAVGIFHEDGRYKLAPVRGSREAQSILGSTDRLIVLEQDPHTFVLGRALPQVPAPPPGQPLEHTESKRVLVVGANRTLPRLIVELDRILSPGSTLISSGPPLCADDDACVAEAKAQCRNVTLERVISTANELHTTQNLALFAADGVVILGCEDELDPDGDASALAILLNLRHVKRAQQWGIKRLVTEVRDPGVAQQIAGSADDFLVSNDVVAMLLAQTALEPGLAGAYRELLDPTGVEIYLVPRAEYVGAGDVTFGEVMAAARMRNEIAIGFFPYPREATEVEPPRTAIELGHLVIDEINPVYLNPPRGAIISNDPNAAIVVLADPPPVAGG